MNTFLTIYGKLRFLGRVVVEDDIDLIQGTPVLIETPRGVEVGTVVGSLSESQETVYRRMGDEAERGASESRLHDVTFLGVPSPEQMADQEMTRRDEDDVLVVARRILLTHGLDMKLVDVEYLPERKKLYLYFTSEGRVDFRAYVRDLAREFKTRIELRQIGARDESKVSGGLGPCGRACCCSYWLHCFMPIGIRMVKEQNLSLNPTKISGLCGRLMCCMSYEQSTYHEIWTGLPSPGSKVKNSEATYQITSIDVAHRTCQFRGPGGFFSIPVELFGQFKVAVQNGEVWNNEAHGLDPSGRPLVEPGTKEALSGCPCPCGKRSCDVSKGESETSKVQPSSDGAPEGGVGPAASTQRRRRRRRRPGLEASSSVSSRDESGVSKDVLSGAERTGRSTSDAAVPSRRPKPRRRRRPSGEGRQAPSSMPGGEE